MIDGQIDIKEIDKSGKNGPVINNKGMGTNKIEIKFIKFILIKFPSKAVEL